MLSKSKIKLLNALKQKKYRQRYNKFIAEGDKIVKEILKTASMKTEALFALPEWLAGHKGLLRGFEGEIVEISSAELKKISLLQTPNQVLVIAEKEAPKELSPPNDLSLLLDGIRDPGNMGTILRIADWFGIPKVYLFNDCVDVYNSKVIQASMGAFLRVETQLVLEENLNEICNDIPVYGAVLDGENIFDLKLESKGIVVIGNESKGIAENTNKFISQRISIPSNGGAESLNAGVATGIICALFRN